MMSLSHVHNMGVSHIVDTVFHLNSIMVLARYVDRPGAFAVCGVPNWMSGNRSLEVSCAATAVHRVTPTPRCPNTACAALKGTLNTKKSIASLLCIGL